MLCECYHWKLEDILWGLTLPQAFRLLDARKDRVDRQNREQEERSKNPDGLSNRELREKHRVAREEGAMPFQDIMNMFPS